MSILS
jgi:hypothetical protein